MLGSSPSADRAIGADRVADPEPAPKALRIVVGQLVDHRERPHLKREHRRVARLGAGNEHRERRAARPRRPRPSRAPESEACGARGDQRPRTASAATAARAHEGLERGASRATAKGPQGAASIGARGRGAADVAGVSFRLECSRLGAPDHQHEARRMLDCVAGDDGARDHPGARRPGARRPGGAGRRERPGPRAGHSPNADDIRTAYWVAIVVAALLILVINAFLVVALVRFRARRGLAAEALRRRARRVPAAGGASGRDRDRPLRLRDRDHEQRPRRAAGRRARGLNASRKPGRSGRRRHGPGRRQAARDQRRRPAVAVAVRLPADAEPAAVLHLLLQRARRPRRHDRDPPHHLDRRGPSLVRPGARRPGGGRPGPRRPRPGSGPTARASTRGSRPLTRAPRTPSCAPGSRWSAPQQYQQFVKQKRREIAAAQRYVQKAVQQRRRDGGGNAMSPPTAVAPARPEIVTEEVPRRRPGVGRARHRHRPQVGGHALSRHRAVLRGDRGRRARAASGCS